MIIPAPIRPAEHLHSKSCVGEAAISAIQNARDAEGFSDHDFALWLQGGGPNSDAHAYLDEGLQTCTCPDCPHSCCVRIQS